jgi:hypothetical protein
MDLKLNLATNVMYAILAAAVLIVLIVYMAKIIRVWSINKWENYYGAAITQQKQYQKEIEDTAVKPPPTEPTWPVK